MGTLPSESKPVWDNWSQNIKHEPPTDGENYYFAPRNLAELKAVVAKAQQDGVVLRASGQRHSQPPLVTDDNRNSVPAKPKNYLVDMSCYADLGPNGDQNMVVDKANKTITVNTGVLEDDVDRELTRNNLMMKTVTAGGFFSIGGMTSVDVHGATIQQPIFSGTVSSFTIVKADGSVVEINEDSAPVGGWKPIDFARVNLGGLGIVTSVTMNVDDRPYATTLPGKTKLVKIKGKSDFVSKYEKLLTTVDRIESFYNPYVDNVPLLQNFLTLTWTVDPNPSNKLPNQPNTDSSACELAAEGKYGAPYMMGGGVAKLAQGSKISAGTAVAAAMLTVDYEAGQANAKYSDLWLTKAARVMFMSYFVEMPKIDANGLGKAWDALQVVGEKVKSGGNFYIAAPMEFRFIKGGQEAMAGTYTTNQDSLFINLDLIGFVDPVPSAKYQPELLQFFADVEREWVAMGGFPHNGKMYGFYDPTAAPGTYTAAFNPNFLANLRERRGERLQAFKEFRESQDPQGVFYNDYLKALLGS